VNYEDLATDFVERTIRNLDAVQTLPRGGPDSLYEVTHLINSLLGLIVVPDELMQDRLPVTTSTSFRLTAGTWMWCRRHNYLHPICGA